MKEKITHSISDSILTKQKILESKDLNNNILSVAECMIKAFKSGNRVWFCGNGGSAGDAQHIAAELSGRYYFDRPPLPAEAMHVNSSYLTAVANDYGYQEVYARYIEAVGKKGDVLVGISTSGNSENILRAYEKAQRKGVTIVSMTGITGGKMKNYSDYLLNVPSEDTPRIQESHIMLGHILCEIIEASLFKKE